METLQLQSRVEAALEELRQMIDQKSVTPYVPKNPVENLIRMDETTNSIFVWNTTTKAWVEYQPV
jgi:hypothetical protein